MTEVNKATVVPYTSKQMYQLVDDIESYPIFLPWCSEGKILNRKENTVTATLCLSLGGMAWSFTTRNTIQAQQRINIELLTGPFKSLNGYWQFDPHNEHGCLIQLYICYEFKNSLINHLAGKIFYRVLDKLIDSFKQRAGQIYGKQDTISDLR